MIDRLRRIVGIALSWGAIWLALWASAGAIMGVFDPGSIDPGEPAGMLVIFGSMGLLAGVVFANLLLSHAASVPRSFVRVVGLGLLATAIAQLPFLGHGDQGLWSNVQVAALFVASGVIVTIVWFVVSRTRSHAAVV